MTIQTPVDISTVNASRSTSRGAQAEVIPVAETMCGLDALVAATLRLVEEEGVGYRAAAFRVLSDTSPDERAVERMLAVGLGVLASDVQTRVNHDNLPNEKDERAQFLGRYQLSTRHQTAADYAMERVRLMGVDGLIKPLADFGVADARSLADEARADQAGAKNRERFAHELEAVLTKHKADSWRALPTTPKTKVEKLAKGAWA